MSTEPLSRNTSLVVLISLLVLCFAVAAVGGAATSTGVREWYPRLDTPPWTPPNWAFAPVWSVLYSAMAVALWDAIRRGPTRAPVIAWGVQLALNAMWSPIFFAWQQVTVALIVITAMWVAIVVCIAVFWRHSRLAAGLMLLYLGWVSVAWSLNAWIWLYNAV